MIYHFFMSRVLRIWIWALLFSFLILLFSWSQNLWCSHSLSCRNSQVSKKPPAQNAHDYHISVFSISLHYLHSAVLSQLNSSLDCFYLSWPQPSSPPASFPAIFYSSPVYYQSICIYIHTCRYFFGIGASRGLMDTRRLSRFEWLYRRLNHCHENSSFMFFFSLVRPP